ncbi:MAG: indole-3-glycerol phosphate synthase TrpC [Deltaproteobacteria bacterium]|nr:indole-3-glycerol phosphate synthase TrpC [Candidatus Zymogenaceae bacterium]
MKASTRRIPVKSGTILDAIVDKKRESVTARKNLIGIDELMGRIDDKGDTRGFHRAIRDRDGVAVIAEIKAKSPSVGVIAGSVDPEAIAVSYQEGGASALSVLTEEDHFGGCLDHLIRARRRVAIPVLRKDFIFDPYQLYEARAAGADAVLLICAILDDDLLTSLMSQAEEIGLDCLVEVHTASERDCAIGAGATLVGINNRDLKTFVTDLATTERIMTEMPKDVTVVSASGVSSGDDVRRLVRTGVKGVLVGESLMRAGNVEKALSELIRGGAE